MPHVRQRDWYNDKSGSHRHLAQHTVSARPGDTHRIRDCGGTEPWAFNSRTVRTVAWVYSIGSLDCVVVVRLGGSAIKSPTAVASVLSTSAVPLSRGSLSDDGKWSPECRIGIQRAGLVVHVGQHRVAQRRRAAGLRVGSRARACFKLAYLYPQPYIPSTRPTSLAAQGSTLT
jgi:hypothetical protein